MAREERERFAAALSCLAVSFASYQAETSDIPVLVGGASVILYTGGMFFSGDMDFVADDLTAMDRCLREHGFLREDRAGHLLVGWYHPEHPLFGFQQVSGDLMDGRAARDRLVWIEVPPGLLVGLPAIEDVIADRLGQHSVASPTDQAMCLQAMALLMTAPRIDVPYLRRRVAEEGGDLDLVMAKTIPGDVDDHVTGGPIRVLSLRDHWAAVDVRSRAFGIDTPAAWDAMRNAGERRTPMKRALLRGIEERAVALGITSLKTKP